MKKWLLLVTSLFVLSACGNGKTTVSSSDSKGETVDDSDVVAEESGEAKLEILKSVDGAWVDSIGTVWVHTAAIFENTGEVAVEIGETQMNYKSTDNSILGTSSMNYAVPEIVQPGETAIIVESTILDGQTSADVFKETTFNFNFEETSDDANLLEVSSVKGIPGEYGYKVTGLIKNTTDKQQDDIRVAAALFDAEGNLVGALNGSVDIGVAPGGEIGFELSYPEIPENTISKIDKIEVKSFGWNW